MIETNLIGGPAGGEFTMIWKDNDHKNPLPAKIYSPPDGRFEDGEFVITRGTPGDAEYHLKLDGNYYFVGYLE